MRVRPGGKRLPALWFCSAMILRHWPAFSVERLWLLWRGRAAGFRLTTRCGGHFERGDRGWRRRSRCAQPQVLTMCKGDFPLALSDERRKTLPSMATTPSHWRAKPCMNRLNAADLDPAKRVFIDQTWASTNMALLYGWAPKRERLRYSRRTNVQISSPHAYTIRINLKTLY